MNYYEKVLDLFKNSKLSMNLRLIMSILCLQRKVNCRKRLTSHQSVLTNLRHCLNIPPLDMFFSASNSAKFNALANISTSAIETNRCKKVTATSTGIPWVGSITSSSFWRNNTFRVSEA